MYFTYEIDECLVMLNHCDEDWSMIEFEIAYGLAQVNLMATLISPLEVVYNGYDSTIATGWKNRQPKLCYTITSDIYQERLLTL